MQQRAAAAAQAASKSTSDEEREDNTGQMIRKRGHVETAESSRSGVLQARAAAVLDVSAGEQVKRRDVRIPPAKLEGERTCRPAHASATCAHMLVLRIMS